MNYHFAMLADSFPKRRQFKDNQKPHIYKGHYFGIPNASSAWNCAGRGVVGSGSTPESAWEDWARKRFQLVIPFVLPEREKEWEIDWR